MRRAAACDGDAVPDSVASFANAPLGSWTDASYALEMKAAAAPETSHDTAPERQGGGRTEPETVATNPLWQLFAMGAQGKLTIGSPDDPLEDEADRVARQ